jgi:hypothetical protein
MRPVVLFRPVDMDDDELSACKKQFPTFRERTAIQPDDLVICRYSCLPFFEAIQADVDYVGAKLINNYREHNYIADIRNWVEDLKDLTPKTWYRLEDIDEEGPYVLKGKTNSRKADWSNMMYAKDLHAAREVYWKLSTDGLIGHQEICIRKFVPLHTYITGLNGIPVTKEFRFFCLYGQILCGAFYWSNYVDDLPSEPKPEPKHYEFVQKILDRVKHRTNFVVIDIAETAAGDEIVVELNDAQMSGLSMNDPNKLYVAIAEAIHTYNGLHNH